MGAVTGGLGRSPAKEARPFWPELRCTFYSGELGTFGNTDDILAPATCLESNVRFNFDHLFETICLKQTDLSGRVPRRPPLPGAPSPGPNLLGAHQLLAA